jgi:hypothetical protein
MRGFSDIGNSVCIIGARQLPNAGSLEARTR